MLKNDVKGHGAIKKLRTGAVVSVLALSVVGTGVVSADEVTQGQPSQPVSTKTGEATTANKVDSQSQPVSTTKDTPSQPVSTTNKDVKVTQGQVDKAKSDSVVATNDVKAQEKVVGGIESKISDTQGTIDSTKAEISEVSKVTPEVVSQAESQASKANDSLTEANKAVSSAENTVSGADKAVSAQEGVVAKAEDGVAKTGKAVSSAQSKVDSLSETTDTSTLKGNVSKLEDTVSSDKADLKNSQDSLEAGKLAESNKDEAIANQNKVIKTAEGVVDTTASDYAGALLAQKGTQVNEDSTKSALDTAKKGKEVTEKVKTGDINVLTADSATLNKGVASSTFLNGKNGVVTNKEYLKAIKALADGTGSVQAVRDAIAKGYWGNSLEDLAAPSSASFAAWAANHNYKFSDTDATTKVSVHDLTDKQLTDLSLFYTALVNDLRSKVGSPLLTVTKESIALAKDSVKKIFHTVYSGHYDNMDYDQLKNAGFLNSFSDRDYSGKPLYLKYTTYEAVKQVNFKDRTVIGQMPSFSNSDTRDDTHLTMADLKLRILAALGNQLYEDVNDGDGGVNGKSYGDFKAAMLILGLDGNKNNSVGVGFDYTGINQGMVNLTPLMFTTLGTSVGTPIDNPYLTLVHPVVTATPVYKTVTHTVVDPEAVAKAQADYDSAVKANSDAKEKVASTETAYTKAQADLLKAQKGLTDLQNNKVNIPALEQAVKDAEDKLSSDSDSLQKAKESLALAEASVADKAQALKVAKSELEDAISANTKAKGVLSQEQSTLQDLVSRASVARVALSDAKTKQASALAVFNTLDAKAKDLADKLANKESVLADLNSKLDEASSKSATLRAELETAKELLGTLKGTANEKMSEYLRLASLKAEQDKAEAEVKRLESLKAKADAIAKDGGVPTPVLNEKGEVVDYIDGKKTTPSVTPAKVVKQAGVTQVGDKITYSRVERAKELPNTGSQESLLALLGASMMASLGLRYVGRRRRQA